MLPLSPRKLTTNFVMLSGGEAVSKILAFVAFAYLARVLRPDTYGYIEFALAVTLFFNLVVEAGFGFLGAREIAKDEHSVPLLAFHIVIIRFFLAICAFLLLILFVAISNIPVQEKQLVVLYGLTLFGTPGLLQWVFQGLDRMHWVAISSIIRWSFFAGGIFLFIYDPEQVWIIPLIDLAAIACVVVLNFSIFRHFWGSYWKRFDTSFALSLMRQAAPIGLAQIMWGLETYLPIIMLGILVGGSEVGWFGAGQRIVIALHTFVWMYYFNLYPSISRCTQQKAESLGRMMAKSLQLTSWCAVFIGVTGSIFAEPLINFVYGSQYGETVLCFQVLIWLVSLAVISGHYMYILIAYNRQWWQLFSATCGGIVSLFMNYLLISNYGFIGAAWAVLCSEAFIWSLNYYFVRHEISIIQLWRHLPKPVISGGVMAAVLFLMPGDNLLLKASLAIIIYGIGLFTLQPGLLNGIRILIANRE